ncbi:hypothetical protein [Bradyrhizobium sp.]|nr:hypothetical protein [Bradyrhizobium sp.]HMM89902.1 hypothetical protein [Bradyrhizobium sp.]
MLERKSLHARCSLKQTLRFALPRQGAHRYFSQPLDSLIASHHHPDIA